MIQIIITSYKEPKSTLRAVKAFFNQKIKDEFRIIVVDPFQETEKFLIKNLSKEESKKFSFFQDPGEGKSYALNMIFQEFGTGDKNDTFILTDGDVYVSQNTVSEIKKAFKDEKVGCVTGKPITLEPLDNKYHYWSHVAFNAIDKFRSNLSQNKKFFECSGYLFAIRDSVIFDFPLETSEDAIIPYLFWKKGYKIKYVPEAKVYVKNPDNWKDYSNQKIRNIKAHENLNKLALDLPRTKSLTNEVREGAFYAISRPRNLKELFWVLQFYPSRLYIYLKAFGELRKKQKYQDGWRATKIESTKTLDR